MCEFADYTFKKPRRRQARQHHSGHASRSAFLGERGFKGFCADILDKSSGSPQGQCHPGVQEYFDFINPHTVGSLTISRASIKWYTYGNYYALIIQ